MKGIVEKIRQLRSKAMKDFKQLYTYTKPFDTDDD